MPMAADEYFALRRLTIEAAAKVLLPRAAPCSRQPVALSGFFSPFGAYRRNEAMHEYELSDFIIVFSSAGFQSRSDLTRGNSGFDGPPAQIGIVIGVRVQIVQHSTIQIIYHWHPVYRRFRHIGDLTEC